MPKVNEHRVIVDTNCWISFLIGQRLSRLVDLLSNERIKLIICSELLEEISEVTTRPKFAKYFPKNEVESLIQFMKLIGEQYEPSNEIRKCRDQSDDYLLNLAIKGHAHYLVTGDQDLLVIKKIGRCRIVDITTFEKAII